MGNWWARSICSTTYFRIRGEACEEDEVDLDSCCYHHYCYLRNDFYQLLLYLQSPQKLERAKFLLSIWSDKQNVEADEDDLDLPLIESSKITNATHNFSIMNKIGEGGFGPVYKGRLEDGQEIAVKKLSSRSTQGTTEFKNETIAIVLLVMHGYCGKRTRPWN
ncbi:hypothetical protein L6164_022503 [Bauhinia variegata]|uniref:Uncharacterized protein n=1 Tax=Bauhinia variegata TaxID=167791 RepID=A0ACB9MIS0_BAUVA|nr:hypothetical protein L6164_022503 [Bauhinia variegata]